MAVGWAVGTAVGSGIVIKPASPLPGLVGDATGSLPPRVMLHRGTEDGGGELWEAYPQNIAFQIQAELYCLHIPHLRCDKNSPRALLPRHAPRPSSASLCPPAPPQGQGHPPDQPLPSSLELHASSPLAPLEWCCSHFRLKGNHRMVCGLLSPVRHQAQVLTRPKSCTLICMHHMLTCIRANILFMAQDRRPSEQCLSLATRRSCSSDCPSSLSPASSSPDKNLPNSAY